MENMREVEVENSAGELVKHIIIDRGNGAFTSMTKEYWEKLQAEREQSGTL